MAPTPQVFNSTEIEKILASIRRIIAEEQPELVRQIQQWRQPRLLGGGALPGLLGLVITQALKECFEEEK